jgi:hypothetical protein
MPRILNPRPGSIYADYAADAMATSTSVRRDLDACSDELDGLSRRLIREAGGRDKASAMNADSGPVPYLFRDLEYAQELIRQAHEVLKHLHATAYEVRRRRVHELKRNTRR